MEVIIGTAANGGFIVDYNDNQFIAATPEELRGLLVQLGFLTYPPADATKTASELRNETIGAAVQQDGCAMEPKPANALDRAVHRLQEAKAKARAVSQYRQQHKAALQATDDEAESLRGVIYDAEQEIVKAAHSIT